MSKNKKIVLLIIYLGGFAIPFIPTLVVIELFFLLIPFAVGFVGTMIYLIISIFSESLSTRKALFVFIILPIFIGAQVLSDIAVDQIQRFRSNRVISEIEKIWSETGVLPENYELNAGIQYTKLKDEEHFIIKYSRGFMVTEHYDSEKKNWSSYGWND